MPKTYDWNDEPVMPAKTAEEAGHFGTTARETYAGTSPENTTKEHRPKKPAVGPLGHKGGK